MKNLNKVTDDIMNRMKNLKQFVVKRDIESIPFNGEFKYTVQHRHGEPAKILVYALTQEEAEQRVNDWLKEQTA